MLFVRELDRRLRAAGSNVRVTAAHPGYTATDLQRTMPFARIMNAVFAMKAHDGALPTMRAAVDPSADSGSYWGPSGWFEVGGPPARAEILPRMKDDAVASRLWDLSEKLTGVTFSVGKRAPESVASA
jgi:NAD(P)-dependent dehydrogenase (short-subunit alcohol dehydrogenase family)